MRNLAPSRCSRALATAQLVLGLLILVYSRTPLSKVHPRRRQRSTSLFCDRRLSHHGLVSVTSTLQPKIALTCRQLPAAASLCSFADRVIRRSLVVSVASARLLHTGDRPELMSTRPVSITACSFDLGCSRFMAASPAARVCGRPPAMRERLQIVSSLPCVLPAALQI